MTEKLAAEESQKVLYDEAAYLIFQKLQNGFADLVFEESTRIVLEGSPVEGTENTYRVTVKDVMKALEVALGRVAKEHLGQVWERGE